MKVPLRTNSSAKVTGKAKTSRTSISEKGKSKKPVNTPKPKRIVKKVLSKFTANWKMIAFSDIDLTRCANDTRYTGTSKSLLKDYFRLDHGVKHPPKNTVRPPQNLMKTVHHLSEKWSSSSDRATTWRDCHLENFKSIRQDFTVQRLGLASAFSGMSFHEVEFAAWALLCNMDAAIDSDDLGQVVVPLAHIPTMLLDWQQFRPSETLSLEMLVTGWVCVNLRLLLVLLRGKDNVSEQRMKDVLVHRAGMIEHQIDDCLAALGSAEELRPRIEEFSRFFLKLRSIVMSGRCTRLLDLVNLSAKTQGILKNVETNAWNHLGVAVRTSGDARSLEFLMAMVRKWTAGLIKMFSLQIRTSGAAALMLVTMNVPVKEIVRTCRLPKPSPCEPATSPAVSAPRSSSQPSNKKKNQAKEDEQLVKSLPKVSSLRPSLHSDRETLKLINALLPKLPIDVPAAPKPAPCDSALFKGVLVQLIANAAAQNGKKAILRAGVGDAAHALHADVSLLSTRDHISLPGSLEHYLAEFLKLAAPSPGAAPVPQLPCRAVEASAEAKAIVAAIERDAARQEAEYLANAKWRTSGVDPLEKMILKSKGK